MQPNILDHHSHQNQLPSKPVNERVQVYVRVRPLFKHEIIEDIQALNTIKNLQSPNPSPTKSNGFMDMSAEDDSMDDPNVTGAVKFTPNQPQMLTLDIRPKEPKKEYVFRSIFRPESSQLEVFEKTALPLVMHVLNGYNGTYFVYGQTGTGKTHSMGVLNQIEATSKGIIPQSLEFIFSSLEDLQNERMISDWKVHISFFQIYLEQVSDLLNPESKNMSIREEHGEVFVGDLVEVPVEDLEQAMNIVNAGLLHRQMASQSMNDTSSRSHTVLHIDVYQTRHKQDSQDQVEYLKGRLVLVDLAGSERVNKTQSKGIRFEEAKHINSSLTTLGNVISCLANPSNKKHSARGGAFGSKDSNFIPYRSSKLTRILTNSLSYDSKIVLLATLGPVRSSFHESTGTLQFAQRCQDIILKPQRHLETEQEQPAQILERLTQHIAEMEVKHRGQLDQMQEAISLRDNHIQALELQISKMQQQLKDQDSENEANRQRQEQQPTYRALQVADMTTFMAKLLQKLTEMSCSLANQFISDSNEFLTALQNDEHVKRGQFESRINAELPIDFYRPFEVSESDGLKFESNTQLLTDESLDIAALVTQLQTLAKKHNQSLSAMAEQSKLSVKLRVRAVQLEKEGIFATNYLRKSLRENSEQLLTEIMKLHRSPKDLPRYLQGLLPRLHDLDSDLCNKLYQSAVEISKQEYQLAEQSYTDGNPGMLANFPQQNFKLEQPQLQTKWSLQPRTQQQILAASIATSHDAKPNKFEQREASPAVAKSHPSLENDSPQKIVNRSRTMSPGLQKQESTNTQNSNNRKKLDVVLHKHPLHVEKSNQKPPTSNSKDTKETNAKTKIQAQPTQQLQPLKEHSFASIVKTQQEGLGVKRQAVPTNGDMEPRKPLIQVQPMHAHTEHTEAQEEPEEADESLRAYANELAQDAQEDKKKRYASGERPPTRQLHGNQRQVTYEENYSGNGSHPPVRNLTDQYHSNLSKGSKRSHATVNSSAHQQCRLDNLILISKGMTEKVFGDLEDFFLQPE